MNDKKKKSVALVASAQAELYLIAHIGREPNRPAACP